MANYYVALEDLTAPLETGVEQSVYPGKSATLATGEAVADGSNPEGYPVLASGFTSSALSSVSQGDAATSDAAAKAELARERAEQGGSGGAHGTRTVHVGG